jgi:putative flippase GtrA
MLWGDIPGHGLFNVSDYRTRIALEHDETRFALHTVAYDPLGVMWAALKNWGYQLVLVWVEDPLRDPHYYLTNNYWKDTNLPIMIEAMGSCGKDHRGCRTRLTMDQSEWLHDGLAILALGLIIARLCLKDARQMIRRRRIDLRAPVAPWLAATALVIFAILINGLICGAISGPFPRYQNRVVWIGTTMAAIGLLALAPARLTRPKLAWLEAVWSFPALGWVRARVDPAFVCFAAVGVSGFLIDRLILAGAIALGLGAYTGRLVSFPAAVGATWLLNRSFTFRQAHAHPPLRQALIYGAVQGAGGALNIGVYWAAIALVPWLKAHLTIPLALGSAAGLCLTFLGSKHIAFRPGGEPAPRDEPGQPLGSEQAGE